MKYLQLIPRLDSIHSLMKLAHRFQSLNSIAKSVLPTMLLYPITMNQNQMKLRNPAEKLGVQLNTQVAQPQNK